MSLPPFCSSSSSSSTTFMASVPFFLTFILLSTIPPPSSPAPILAPLLSHCHAPTYLLDKDASLNCCPPSWPGHPLQFHFHDYPQSRLRLRPAAHLVDPSYAHKLNRAYRLMKALPPEDPRSFSQQANIHCAWCNQIYNQVNSSLPIQIHNSWLFFPFHRWYLYFHERILGTLLEDDTFALLFWNYDSPEGSTIPRMYLEYKDLFDAHRNAAAQPPAVAPFDYAWYNNASNRPRDEQLAVNAALMYRSIVSGTPTPSLFYGEPYRAGDEPMPGRGAVETTAHNSVHYWVGDPEYDRKDMGVFYTSALDPVFYAHHASLDRMWELWKSIEGHEDFDDSDFLNSEFIFYNERAELVKVTVRDSLDARKLGFTYEKVEIAWMNARPSALSKGPIETVPETLAACSLKVESPCYVKVERNKVDAVQGGEEVLVMEGIEVLRDRATHFNVFVNLPTADASTLLNCTEFAGSFLNIPMMLRGAAMHHHAATSKLRLSLSFIVQELNLAAADSLFVTIVPVHDPPLFSPIAFSSMKIEYESVLYRSIIASS